MSIYVANSPYRSSVSGRKLKISFPKLHGIFEKRRSGGVTSSGRMGCGQGISIQERRMRREASTAAGNGSLGNRPYAGGDRPAGGSRKGDVVKAISTAAGNVCGSVIRLRFSPMTAIVGMLVIAVLISCGYLAQFNQVATKGYDLRRLEADRQQLMNQHDIKNMKLAEAKSMSRVIESDRVSVMRRPSELIYVRGNTALASR